MFLAESSRSALRPFSRSMHGIACAGARGPCSIWPVRETSVVPRRNAEEVVREFPSTKVVTIDGPHLALYTNPGAAVDAIVGFMRESA